MPPLSEILASHQKPALFIGNGINRHNNDARSSWDDLLQGLMSDLGVSFTNDEISEMSNTELFDLLDLARPAEDRSSLQARFCESMESWEPAQHHNSIIGWAQRHRRPVITVNFDENLSLAVKTRRQWLGKFSTDYYPWNCYFSDTSVTDPKSEFAIWHAHGMMHYKRSIRLGLTHYMGSAQRARQWVYGSHGLRALAKNVETSWRGANSWLEVLFFCPLVILGFSFSKDETFLRWLFLERARLQKTVPAWKAQTWFVDVPKNGSLHRKPFFQGLQMQYVVADSYKDIYENPAWNS